jgi:hypothetical protein
MLPKFYIGPMTKNVVDAVIQINEEHNKRVIGLIPSRRQIEYDGGYVNNWTTKEFSNYVKENSCNTIIKRDHGGEGQGKIEDNGLESFKNDIENNFDIIHVDPWKKSSSILEASEKTISNINYCLTLNKNAKFEIGTEQAIYEYSEDDLQMFLSIVKKELGNNFNTILYAVIQGGTKIKDNKNFGLYDREKLIKMSNIVKNYALLSKEHNGDYLTRTTIEDRFNHGLDAINIAPEFGVFETKYLLGNLSEIEFNKFYEICYNSKKWEKWISSDFNFDNKTKLIEICGHYNFMSDVILDFKNKNKDFDVKCKEEIVNYIKEKFL